MRVIAGRWRGRPLVAPAGQATRPTADRARETLFSMLASRLGGFDDLRVADLYAGSGALGIEALSRGAAHCTFIDRDRAAVDAIRKNLATLDATTLATVNNCGVESVRSPQPYDLVFADPPYADSACTVIAIASDRHLIAPGGWFALETGRGSMVDPGSFMIEAERDVGRARLTILRNA